MAAALILLITSPWLDLLPSDESMNASGEQKPKRDCDPYSLPHLLPFSSEISDRERLFDPASSCSSLPYPPDKAFSLSYTRFLSSVKHCQLQHVALVQTRQICLLLLKNVKDLSGVN